MIFHSLNIINITIIIDLWKLRALTFKRFFRWIITIIEFDSKFNRINRFDIQSFVPMLLTIGMVGIGRFLSFKLWNTYIAWNQVRLEAR